MVSNQLYVTSFFKWARKVEIYSKMIKSLALQKAINLHLHGTKFVLSQFNFMKQGGDSDSHVGFGTI